MSMFEHCQIVIQPLSDEGDDYHYTVTATDDHFELSFKRIGNEEEIVGFYSVEEMESVAKAMLKIVKMLKM